MLGGAFFEVIATFHIVEINSCNKGNKTEPALEEESSFKIAIIKLNDTASYDWNSSHTDGKENLEETNSRRTTIVLNTNDGLTSGNGKDKAKAPA